MGIFQARKLEWFAISFSRGSSQSRDGTRSSVLQADSLLTKLTGKLFSQCRKPNSEMPSHLGTALPWSHILVWSVSHVSFQGFSVALACSKYLRHYISIWMDKPLSLWWDFLLYVSWELVVFPKGQSLVTSLIGLYPQMLSNEGNTFWIPN